jgi:ATP-dependent Lon protease
VAKIVKRINFPDGGVNIFISTLKRFRIKKFLNAESPFVTAVEYLEDANDSSD